MHANWWPSLLEHIPTEEPWAEASVSVACLRSFDGDPIHPGERRSYTVLIPLADIDAVLAAPAGLAHEVSSTGPNPGAGAAGQYEPQFWVSARDLPQERFEPFILAWLSNDQTVLAPDPRFLMTYGLVPRAVAGGITIYDEPTGPTFDVVEVGAPSVWSTPVRTISEVRVVKDYLQDYLTLRGVALFEVFYEIRRGAPDADSLEALGGREIVEHRFSDRVFQLNYRVENDQRELTAQVWGARMIAGPADLPITADPLDRDGLLWPGFDNPVTTELAYQLTVNDYVYVDDTVLAAYEGQAGFDIHPETGAVGFGGQWGVGFCSRVGRNIVRLELKKLYEGAPPSAIRHWHRHAISPTPALLRPEARNERNIAMRSKEIVLSLAAIGERLNDLATAIGLNGTLPEEFVGLNEADLEHRGWWMPERVQPIARHVPLDLDRDRFLRRCVELNNLLVEGLGQSNLRSILVKLGVAPKKIEGFRGLKLLDYVVRLAQVSISTGYKIPSQAQAILDELEANGTEPARPLEHIFALYDLRIVGSHAIGDTHQELVKRLERFEVEPGDCVGGLGQVLDIMYDALAGELEEVHQTLGAFA